MCLILSGAADRYHAPRGGHALSKPYLVLKHTLRPGDVASILRQTINKCVCSCLDDQGAIKGPVRERQ